jgi:hypothetical protein
MEAGTGSSSGGSTDASADAPVDAAGPFACGSVMCMAPGQYCSVQTTGFGSNTNYQCMQAPFNCSSGATCACVQPFDAGTPGCTCATNNNGDVTVTCHY